MGFFVFTIFDHLYNIKYAKVVRMDVCHTLNLGTNLVTQLVYNLD